MTSTWKADGGVRSGRGLKQYQEGSAKDLPKLLSRLIVRDGPGPPPLFLAEDIEGDNSPRAVGQWDVPGPRGGHESRKTI